MIKVLVVLGSPRKKGNSETLTQTMLEGFQEINPIEVEYLYLHGIKNISPCRGCGGCDKSGNCVIKDDQTDLYLKVDEADLLLLVTPVYFYGPSAQIKTFIDRFQARWSRKYLLQQRVRADERRMGVLLSTAATKGPKVFDATLLIAKSFFDTVDIKYGGELLIRSVDEKGALAQKQEVLAEARQFGRELAEKFRQP